MTGKKKSFIYKLDKSAVLTAIGIILLFAISIISTLVIPQAIESTWVQPTSPYQRQMYEVADPMLYISALGSGGESDLQLVYHLQQGKSLQAFKEDASLKIVAPKELEKYITRFGNSQLLLTSELLFLREPQEGSSFNAKLAAEDLRKTLQKDSKELKLRYEILELYRPEKQEAFAAARTDGIIEDWVDENFKIVEGSANQNWHGDPGVVYVNNPVEYRIKKRELGGRSEWHFHPEGETIDSLEVLKAEPFGFLSRKVLIEFGEDIYRAEGCWYCHTDQTRTLIQDVVLNGADDETAPPSTASEYIYQRVTFPGTRRIGPDLSRTGVKRPSRDWHKAHFWAPKTESPGSIMPRFQHFFDDDPRGTSKNVTGVPNVKFEAIFQYLMTKGTRITAPTKAWWTGRDPVDTKAVIEGRVNPDQEYNDRRRT